MPNWLYEVSPPVAAIIMVTFIEFAALVGLVLARRHLIPRLHYDDGANDAVSGTVQAIGVFYRDVNSYPSPLREELCAKLREYTVFVIEQAWPAQKRGEGQKINNGTLLLDDFQQKLYSFQPGNLSQSTLHAETLRAYNTLLE